MLKKLTIAGAALIVSSSMAFADDTSVNAAVDVKAPAATTTTTTTTTAVKHKHRYHHKQTHHKKHYKHYYKSVVTQTPESMENTTPAPMATAASGGDYKGDYKGEAVPVVPECAHSIFVGGPYLGVGVGSRTNYSHSPGVFNGIDGTLFGGYGMTWDQVYGALEIFAQDSAQVSNYNQVANVGSSWGYGLSVLPGYLLTDNVLGYVRLGIVDTRFSAGNTTAFGGQTGLGLETALSMNWDLRGEYVYSFYRGLGGSTGVGNPRSQVFNLALVYKFQN